MPRTPIPLIVLFALLGSALVVTGEKYRDVPSPRLQSESDQWAERTLRALSLEEKVGQLFMIRLRVELLGEGSPEYLQLRDSIRKYHVGAMAMSVPAQGSFLYGNDRYRTVTLLNNLQSESRLPLLDRGGF